MMVRDFKELHVYQKGFSAALHILKLSETWPKHEKYALTDQVRRSCLSVCSNLAEAWMKRAYPKHFTSKLSNSLAEAAETIVWLDFATASKYVNKQEAEELQQRYRGIIRGLLKMMRDADNGCGPSRVQEDMASYG